MALADIVRRIDEDAAREADAVVAEARETAGQAVAEAKARAEAERERILSDAREQAELGARTKLARARIAARDRSLGAKRELVERAIAETVARLEVLPDAEYVALIAREVVAAARGGERVQVAAGDVDRLAAPLEAALAEAGVELEIAGATDAIARGVLLEGDRMRTEISTSALVASRSDELTSVVAVALFGAEG